MFFRLFTKTITRLKEVYELAMLGSMVNKNLFIDFNAGPLYFVMLPLLGILATINTLIKGYELSMASNKNLDQWLSFITSIMTTSLSSISLYGAAIAAYYDLSFALGPWFFIASIALAFFHQLIQFSITLLRLYESFHCFRQRQHYVQAALSNLLSLGLITAVAGAVTFILLTPFAPVLGNLCAVTAITLTALNMLWSTIPVFWRSAIKHLLGFENIDLACETCQTAEANIIPVQSTVVIPHSSVTRIFSKQEFSTELSHKSYEQGRDYIEDIICKKIDLLSNSPRNEKNTQKKALLKKLLSLLDNNAPITKSTLSREYPLALQSFWADKGEVEQIIDAALSLWARYEAHQQKSTHALFTSF